MYERAEGVCVRRRFVRPKNLASIFAHSADDAVAIDVERLSRLDRLPEGTTKVPSPFEGAAVR